MILDRKRVKLRLKEEQDWLVFIREVLLMLKKLSTHTIFQFINHSHYHIPMIMQLLKLMIQKKLLNKDLLDQLATTQEEQLQLMKLNTVIKFQLIRSQLYHIHMTTSNLNQIAILVMNMENSMMELENQIMFLKKQTQVQTLLSIELSLQKILKLPENYQMIMNILEQYHFQQIHWLNKMTLIKNQQLMLSNKQRRKIYNLEYTITGSLLNNKRKLKKPLPQQSMERNYHLLNQVQLNTATMLESLTTYLRKLPRTHSIRMFSPQRKQRRLENWQMLPNILMQFLLIQRKNQCENSNNLNMKLPML